MLPEKIFIIGQPRSGTTLMQRLLNSVEAITIFGEHLGILIGIASSYRSFLHHPKLGNYADKEADAVLAQLKDPSVFAPTSCGLNRIQVKRGFKELIDQLSNPLALTSGITGFKEIRYGATDDYVIEMLLELFEGSRIVLLLRNPVDQITHTLGQGWWNLTFEECIANWRGQADNFTRCARTFPDRVKMITFDQLSSPTSQFHSVLFAWLGLNWTSIQEKVLREFGRIGASKDCSQFKAKHMRDIQHACTGLYEDVMAQLANLGICKCNA